MPNRSVMYHGMVPDKMCYAAADIMDETVVRTDKTAALRSIVINLAVSGGVGAYLYFNVPFWLFLVVFGYISAVCLYKVVRLGNQVVDDRLIVLDSEGITDRSYGLGFIPWTQVRGAQVQTTRYNILGQGKVVELDLRDPEALHDSDSTTERELVQFGRRKVNDNVFLNPLKLIFSGAKLDVVEFWLTTYQADRTADKILSLVERGIEMHEKEVA